MKALTIPLFWPCEKSQHHRSKESAERLIDRVKAGSTVLIVDRGRPVARLEPVHEAGGDGDGRLSRLVRDGAVGPARGPGAKRVLATRPPRAKGSASGIRALLDERRGGR